MLAPEEDRGTLAWKIGVWNRISPIYQREIDRRFAPVVEAFITRADLATGEHVLDLGTGTGAAAERASVEVGPSGRVVGVDVSPEMLALARLRSAHFATDNLTWLEGRAEEIPAEDTSFDVVLACLSVMYVIDREAAAREIARVLRPGGRLVARAGRARTSATSCSFSRQRAASPVRHPHQAWAPAPWRTRAPSSGSLPLQG